MLLQESIGSERRPLSWVVGPQGVTRMPERSLRDEKRQTRMRVKTLRSPDSV